MSFYFKNQKGSEFIFIESNYSLYTFAKIHNKNVDDEDEKINADDFEFFTDLENITGAEMRYIVDESDNKFKNYKKVPNKANDVYVLNTPLESFHKLIEFNKFKYESGSKIFYKP